ncbi:dephospho-CoA kinase [Kwoniella shivajii]|uniref:Dephospho-CoA kinase n=1 Tax=Kwoniella shivajii TaxID=564305 RepID=A0ABZ1CTJ3_9TREE|nr:dephospho-CoA kinase [Kwoniella shivajii]
MLVVGLTGGIASGKSTVSSLFSNRHNIPIIDADLLAREVIEPETVGYQKVIDHFGADRILQDDGYSLNRASLGEIIFNDENERKWLNNLIHPLVRKEIVKRTMKYWFKGHWCVIVDVPLLVEAGMWKFTGEICIVYINEKLQLSRLMSRSQTINAPLTQTQASSRINSQMALSQKLSYATSVLDNSGSLQDLTGQVDRLVGKWKKGQGGKSGWWWKVCWLLPPVGLTAGALVLLGRWWKGNQKERRRARGEVERNPSKEENIELRDMRRRTGSSSITDDQ